MIRVHIERTFDGKIASFTMEGHAGFAEHGQDIVCAGASAVAFGSVNAIMALTGVDPDIEQSESGFLKCSFPDQLSKETSDQVQLLLEAMIVSLQTIERDYKKHIKISFKK
ncbi:ribosomal-processing cysteine protease Prp [Lederbergia citrea]|uniref:Ribosomal processing cysteine protease Prp n=1 Tax=Lederbergia citrea TaxID=2833581 RepID=A0A942Z2I5_9BACI|nr:ribosomal-processing cysteine protease Prp [Lederbergia citrea]MBS4176204.1 ribosomal-processing cysteine protease Prp [Lederbergia citrea]MBS4202764.1 ribosomal-processing cysteine protease Prp [Lederbergia citrea]MBS4222568.1 ribosomal-processing cysteine protease Prp [Lederbergia citrea]